MRLREIQDERWSCCTSSLRIIASIFSCFFARTTSAVVGFSSSVKRRSQPLSICLILSQSLLHVYLSLSVSPPPPLGFSSSLRLSSSNPSPSLILILCLSSSTSQSPSLILCPSGLLSSSASLSASQPQDAAVTFYMIICVAAAGGI